AARARSLRYQNGLIDSTSRSTAIASIALSRSSSVMNASDAPLTGDVNAALSSPINWAASWKRQCAWTSIVFTRFPPTLTGRRWPAGCAHTASSQAQLQKATPGAAVRVKNCLRVCMVPSVSGSACPPHASVGLDRGGERDRRSLEHRAVADRFALDDS